MHVYVEFTGDARLATGTREIELDLMPGATFRDMVCALSTRYPALIGNVLLPDGVSLQPSNLLNLNGRRMLQASQMEEIPGDGDRVTFMSILAGG